MALFEQLRAPQTGGSCSTCSFYDSCRCGCMAAKFFTGLALDGPDPECVQGHAEHALAGARTVPAPSHDHSHASRESTRSVPVELTRAPARPPVSACAESPLAGLALVPSVT